MPRAPMTELEENTLRSLMSRMREEQPLEFLDIVLQTVLIRLDENTICSFNHKNNEGQVDAVFAVFKGGKVAEWANQSLLTLKKRLDDMDPEEDAA